MRAGACAAGLSSAALVCVSCAQPGGSASAESPAPLGTPDLPAARLPSRSLDEFDELSAWRLQATDGVWARLEAAPGVEGGALELRFDFRGHGGYASARRALPLELPENFELSFELKGRAPPNDWQLKFVDASGDNVWWFRRQNVEFDPQWRRVVVKKRQLEFAWGPTRSRELERAAALELVVAAGKGGGSGSLSIDRLRLRELPMPPAVPPTPVATASTSRPGAEALLVVDQRRDTAWRPARSDEPQTLWLDLGYPREFGGLVLRWLPGAHASDYDVLLSTDGKRWNTVRRVRGGNGGSDAIRLPESEARFVQLVLEPGASPSLALAEVEVQDLEFGATLNGFVSALAPQAPRGAFPRAFVGEQSYWTLVAGDGTEGSGLMSEDGALELAHAGASIEPFVVQAGKNVSWADVVTQHSLGEGYLPAPRVVWQHPDWRLEVSTFAAAAPNAPRLGARYSLENQSLHPLKLQLVLLVRPFQVNPPTQSLNLAGGVSPIHALSWDGASLWLDQTAEIFPLRAPDHVGLSRFDDDGFPNQPPPKAGRQPRVTTDPTGLASAALVYDVTLAPRAKAVRWLAAGAAPRFLGAHRGLSALELEREAEGVLGAWREKLNHTRFRVPPEAQVLVDTLRSSLAHILMSREGAALKPGARSYARSWIRDGAMMSEALLRLGHADVARAYLNWYAPFQFENGKVPCSVDARGADPVPENDSAGQLIFLAAEIYRFTHDRELLERIWPKLELAARYQESLRQSERGPKNAEPDRRRYYGLMPPSISHEGYSDKPAYAYWDDFWALVGYQDAAYLARVLGKSEASVRLAAQRDEFRRELHASLRQSAKDYGVSFLPGAADRGDFDSTSTTIALAPGREQSLLAPELLLGTFERYYEEFRERQGGQRDWDVYTPYELRAVGSFIRLGWRDRAHELLQFFLADRRPAGWNQWAEVVGRLPRRPLFIGDMPHAWVASDFIRSVLDVFAYTRASDEALVLAAGVPARWLEGDGIQVDNLYTPTGQFGYALKRRDRLELDIRGDSPPAGFVLPWPLPGHGGTARINGTPVAWDGRELRIHKTPSRVSIDLR